MYYVNAPVFRRRLRKAEVLADKNIYHMKKPGPLALLLQGWFSSCLFLHVSVQTLFPLPKYNTYKEKPCNLNPLLSQGIIQSSEFSQTRACSSGISKAFLSERVKVMSHMEEPECVLKNLVSWKSVVQLFQSTCMHGQKE